MSALQDLREETTATKAWLQNFADVLGDDTEAIALSIESETSLPEAIEKAVTRVLEINSLIEGMKWQRQAIEGRKARLERQADLLRSAICEAMASANMKRLETAVATLTRKPTPATAQVINEAEIPTQFWKRPDPVLDKRALLAALKEGSVPGAELTNGGETVQIKWG